MALFLWSYLQLYILMSKKCRQNNNIFKEKNVENIYFDMRTKSSPKHSEKDSSSTEKGDMPALLPAAPVSLSALISPGFPTAHETP